MTLSIPYSALSGALEARGYTQLTPVQSAVLESNAAERDLLVSAQTGSGKTVAYGLALASTLLGTAEALPPAAAPMALVVAPTRELALQVQRELEWLYGPAGGRIVSCVGGMDVRREQRALSSGAHIVVGTPGRLRDHLERGRLDISKLAAVVLDEADEMLDLGFREDLEFILDASPGVRRTLLFSATLPREIVKLAKRYQHNALRIDTNDENQPHRDIEYRAYRVAPNEIEPALVNILRYTDAPTAIVFCATREAVRRLHGALLERGFLVVALSGELSQTDRTMALQTLRDGRAQVCVATDVAARGLDLPDLGLVVHADLPQNHETLLHRSGRTGRAGRKGVSALIVPYNARSKAQRLITAAGVEAYWTAAPSADEIRQRDHERLMDSMSTAEPPTDDEAKLAEELLGRLGPNGVAIAFLRLDRARLPAPEELFDPGPQVDGRNARESRGRQRAETHRHERIRSDRSRGGREDGASVDASAGPQGQDEDRRPPLAIGSDSGAAWYKMSIGRQKNADPKWLLPLICRRGHVTRNEVGAIRIFDKETVFEINADAADRFEMALARGSAEDIRIERQDGPPNKPMPTAKSRKPRPEGTAKRPRRPA
ncbi:helicase [Kaistia algarum]|uniref:DEAD/DEAH box helicase n=1 Tax=Kaistia algarum TaxID=2083279 RepID=UPI000CE80D06|nr:DEAD/DEAH box helicase [Kaistia algarum]MCX5514710.1 DEAD/DEAH box helicase [Kaistia algarum]PPE78995.1 helicase [Kaistia algarum]